MNCSTKLEIDCFIKDILECTNHDELSYQEIITRLNITKSNIRVSLLKIDTYFNRLIQFHQDEKWKKWIDVSNQVEKLRKWIANLKDFANANIEPRKEILKKIHESFKILLKVHEWISIENFEWLFNGNFFRFRRFLKNSMKKITWKLVIWIIWTPWTIYGSIQFFQWILSDK